MSRASRWSIPAMTATLLLSAGLAQAQVGMDQQQVADLSLTLVYPTDTPATTQTLGPFRIDVAMRSPVAPGRHRLVVMSHGSGGSAIADHALAAALARAGFVVAQPLHQGDNHQDQRLSGPASFQRRPSEITQTIDALAADPRWVGHLQLERVGVHGMSAGGVSGLALAGAQWRTQNLLQHCNAHGVDDAGFCFQGATTSAQRAERQAQLGRVNQVPEAQLPAALTAWHGGLTPSASAPDPRPDPRVAAVSLAVPVAAIFSAESLARIRIPVGLVRAQGDQVLLPRFHTDHVLAQCSTCTLLADLRHAGHFDLLWPWPASVAQQVAAMQPRGGLPNPAFDPAEREAAHAKIVAFHLQHLNGP